MNKIDNCIEKIKFNQSIINDKISIISYGLDADKKYLHLMEQNINFIY